MRGEEGNKRDIEDSKTADFINEFFCKIGPKLADGNNHHGHFYGEEDEAVCPSLITDYDPTSRLCKEIKVSKLSGIEDVPSTIFKVPSEL